MSPLVLELLSDVATGRGGPSSAVLDALQRASAEEFRWALDAGLGPWLCAAAGDGLQGLDPGRRELVLGSDLTARVRAAELLETALDVVDACLDAGVTPTLLKGMALAPFLYPQAHYRPMTDVDVLLPAAAVAALDARLLELGYERSDPVMDDDAHHLEPLYHPRTGIRVELHMSLFPASSPLRTGTTFGDERIAAESTTHSLAGRPVRRLSTELHFVYLASAWNRDLSGEPVDPSFLFGLFDAVTLGRNGLGWPRVPGLLDCRAAAASVDVLLDWLVRHGLVSVPEEIHAAIRERHDLVGPLERSLLRWIVNSGLVRGRPFRWCNSWRIWGGVLADGRPGLKALSLPWRVAFPPGDVDRFDLRTQARRWRRWASGTNAVHRR